MMQEYQSNSAQRNRTKKPIPCSKREAYVFELRQQLCDADSQLSRIASRECRRRLELLESSRDAREDTPGTAYIARMAMITDIDNGCEIRSPRGYIKFKAQMACEDNRNVSNDEYDRLVGWFDDTVSGGVDEGQLSEIEINDVKYIWLPDLSLNVQPKSISEEYLSRYLLSAEVSPTQLKGPKLYIVLLIGLLTHVGHPVLRTELRRNLTKVLLEARTKSFEQFSASGCEKLEASFLNPIIDQIAVKEELSNLSHSDQQLLTMVYREQIGYREVSTITGINTVTLRKRCERLIKRLRKVLGLDA